VGFWLAAQVDGLKPSNRRKFVKEFINGYAKTMDG